MRDGWIEAGDYLGATKAQHNIANALMCWHERARSYSQLEQACALMLRFEAAHVLLPADNERDWALGVAHVRFALSVAMINAEATRGSVGYDTELATARAQPRGAQIKGC